LQQNGTKPLRVGVVGLGWAGETHLKNYLKVPGVEVVAVAALEEDRRQAMRDEYGVPGLYEDYREMISRDDIDAVSVATPNHLHAPVSIAALKSGKHVLCEKPLARTGPEAAGISTAAAEANRVLRIAFSQREREDVRILKQYVEEGRLGRIYHAKATWMRRNGIPGMGGWFTNKEMAGGGPLIDLGVHMLDMALYLIGEPDVLSVSAATYAELGPRGRGGRTDSKQTFGGAYEVEDLATAFVRLQDGATMNLEAGWAVYGNYGDDFGITLYGTEGGAEMKVKNYGWRDTLRIFTDVAGVPAEISPQLKPGEGHAAVVRRFVETIRSGDWSVHSGEDGLRRARVIDATYASALQGSEVILDPAEQQVSA
jgi:predicted dehydrogenase